MERECFPMFRTITRTIQLIFDMGDSLCFSLQSMPQNCKNRGCQQCCTKNPKNFFPPPSPLAPNDEVIFNK
jgi:hypothetical protein